MAQNRFPATPVTEKRADSKAKRRGMHWPAAQPHRHETCMRLIAELRQNIHALTVANRKLKELDRLKTQFRVRRRMQRKIEDGATAPPEGLAGKSRSSGLGLAIVKRIVEAHNGYVTVTSEPGIGSTFRLILPILQPETEAVST